MNCIFQIVSTRDGVRSKSAEGTREQFADALGRIWDEAGHEFTGEEDLVLVVAEQRDGTGWHVSQAPVMKVSTFVKEYARESIQ